MKISELWKKQVKDVLLLTYKGKMSEDKIDKYLDSLIKEKEKDFPIMRMRNLYTRKNFAIHFDTLLNTIKDEQLCIGANGTLTYSYKRVETPIPDILIKMKRERKEFKQKALDMEEKINKIEENGGIPSYEDKLQLKYFDNTQTKIKEDMNSFFGIQAVRSSFVYNPDTVGMITGQARQLISEMMWSIERFLGSNIPFDSVSEAFVYINSMIKESHESSVYDSYISYIPTKEDINHRILELLQLIPNYKLTFDEYSLSLFHLVDNLSERERIYLYYKDNLFEFLNKNPKVFLFIDTLITSNTDFMNPAEIPNEFILPLETLHNILDEFVISHISTPNRVLKYMNKSRRSVLLSDTDSIIINLDPWVELCNSLSTQKFDSFDDEKTTFKVINIASYLSTEVTKVAGKIYCNQCNIPEDLHGFVEMKNEYLFKRLVLYKHTKKNYIAHTRLREGTFVDRIDATGIKLRGSAINPTVQKQMIDIIDEKILKAKYINPVEILRSINSIEKDIIEQIKSGDKTYGRRSRYSGPDGYKTGVYQNSSGRGAFIWNILVPDEAINIHDYSYLFKTKVNTVEDCENLLSDHPSMQRKIADKIFGDENLRRYGLSMICVPIEGTKPMPQWLIDIIDTEDVTNKHLQPIISLLPSIGIYNSRLSSTKTVLSSIISF